MAAERAARAQAAPSGPGPGLSLPGILHFIQHEWARFEAEKGRWEAERAELQAQVAFLQASARAGEPQERPRAAHPDAGIRPQTGEVQVPQTEVRR
ncbi:striatin-4 [Amazona ochrocephala]